MDEREEGEITEGDLSDISSEEEYLLRQRLHVLESYNNVLERKEAKRRRSESQQTLECDDKTQNRDKRNDVYEEVLPDLSDISGSDLENSAFLNEPMKELRIITKTKQLKSTKKRNAARKVTPSKKKYEKLSKHIAIEKKETKSSKTKTHKEKHRKYNSHKKPIESSDETDYEYRNKRRKLQHSVQINNTKTDTSSTLKMRLMKMFSDKTNSLPCEEDEQKLLEVNEELAAILETSIDSDGNVDKSSSNVEAGVVEPILLSDESISNSNDVIIIEQPEQEPKSPVLENANNKSENLNSTLSDDDIEVLRQNALLTKSQKPAVIQPDHISDSEDDDELRVICLKSKFLKKAMELKRKHKLTKKMADMSSVDDILASKLEELSNADELSEHSHNTDIESVDMEIGVSDGPDTDDNVLKEKEPSIVSFNAKTADIKTENVQENIINKLFERRLSAHPKDVDVKKIFMDNNSIRGQDLESNKLYERRSYNQSKESEVDQLFEQRLSTHLKDAEEKLYERRLSVRSNDAKSDLEEDEDLLRAKLLTSLSNNLALLRKKTDKVNTENASVETPGVKFTAKPEPESKRFIINIGESDSGSDNETTKNLTKMHMKLAENVDFQQKLDMFLKNARTESEKSTVSTIDEPSKSKSPEKFVPKALNHLPKSRQLEYRRLVKRMVELERLKQNRQATLSQSSKTNSSQDMTITVTGKETRIIQHISNITQKENARDSSKCNDVLETKIAISRKRIAAESTKMLRLKEESVKLSQKHKMAITELRNIRTAMALNKREISTVQVSLAGMRNQHQLLLKRSTTQLQNTVNYGKTYTKNELPKSAKPFENKSTKDILKNRTELKSVTVSVVNDLQEKTVPGRNFSVQVDLSNMKKTVSMPKEFSEESTDLEKSSNHTISTNQPDHGIRESSECRLTADPGGSPDNDRKRKLQRSNSSQERCKESLTQTSKLRNTSSSEADDYKSPLTAMKLDVSWKGDPHGILCPYEVLGTCKDADCQYQHASRD